MCTSTTRSVRTVKQDLDRKGDGFTFNFPSKRHKHAVKNAAEFTRPLSALNPTAIVEDTSGPHRRTMAESRGQLSDHRNAPVDTAIGVVAGAGADDNSSGMVTGGSSEFVPQKPRAFPCLTLKPLAVVHAEEDEGVLERTLGFWDLFALGFGGTIGRLVCAFIAGMNRMLETCPVCSTR